MGQPAFSKIYVSFETKKKTKEAHDLLKKFDKIIKKRWDGDADMCNLSIEGNTLSCEVHSQRVQNCEWQVERVAILLSEIGGVEEFTSDLFMMGDGLYFDKSNDDGTFEEFVEDFEK